MAVWCSLRCAFQYPLELLLKVVDIDQHKSLDDLQYLDDERSALHLAAEYGRVDVVKLLIKHEAHVDVQDIVSQVNGMRDSCSVLYRTLNVGDTNHYFCSICG